MKPRILVFLLVTGAFLNLPCFAANVNPDEINLLLCEYQNGVKTGNFVHVDFIVYGLNELNGKPKWQVTEESFSLSEGEKKTMVVLQQSTSESYDPVIENINWEPSKSFECDFKIDWGTSIHFVAKKIKGSLHGWKVLVKGSLKMTKAMPSVSWEFKKVDALDLKYSNLVLPQDFRGK